MARLDESSEPLTAHRSLYKVLAGDNRNVCVATMTLARTAEEAAVLRAALQSLAELDVPTVVVDGGSGADFVDFLRGFPHFDVLAGEPGVVGQARQSLRRAAQFATRFVLYTEPDKQQFFELYLKNFVARLGPDEPPALLVAARSADGFATFPEFQRYAETVISEICARYVRLSVDFCYGPLILERTLVPVLDDVGADVGWGWRFFLFALVRRLGRRIEAYVDDFACPPEQREEEDGARRYRLRQLDQNIRGLLLGLECPLPRE